MASPWTTPACQTKRGSFVIQVMSRGCGSAVCVDLVTLRSHANQLPRLKICCFSVLRAMHGSSCAGREIRLCIYVHMQHMHDEVACSNHHSHFSELLAPLHSPFQLVCRLRTPCRACLSITTYRSTSLPCLSRLLLGLVSRDRPVPIVVRPLPLVSQSVRLRLGGAGRVRSGGEGGWRLGVAAADPEHPHGHGGGGS